MGLDLFIVVISSICLIVVAVTAGLYIYNPTYLNKLLLFIAISLVLGGFIQGIPSEDDEFMVMLSYSITFLINFSIALVLGYFFGLPTQTLIFTTLLLIGVAGSTLLYTQGAPFWLMAQPVAWGVTSPILVRTIQGYRRWNTQLTAAGKTLVVIATLQVIHYLDYPWLRPSEAASIFGFLLGAMLPITIIVLASVIELERSVIERTRAQEANTMKSRFFANISHEIRTPLTLLLGPLERLRTNASLSTDHQASQLLKTAETNGNRLLQLINQILDASKLEAGKMQIHVREYNVVEITRSLVETFNVLASSTHIAFLFRAPETPFTFFCDLDKFQKILYNLLSNAFKFSDEHAKILMTVSGPLEATEAYPEGSFSISIKDTGAGIPAKELPYIFDRFRQVDSSSKRLYQGTGLGLALVKEFVELHHGDIQVSSEVGFGSEFTVTFPLGNSHLSDVLFEQGASHIPNNFPTDVRPLLSFTNESLVEPVREREGSETILLVEDNAEVRAFIRTCIEGDFVIIEAVDGEDGLEKARHEIPDLIISDLFMPRLDGHEFCLHVKQDRKLGHIPIIMLTSSQSQETLIEGLEHGADAYMTKPFQAHELNVRIRNLLENRDRVRENARLKHLMNIETEEEHTHEEQTFLGRALQVVKERLHDQEFSVEAFAEAMFISPRQLQRLLKQHTGEPPTRFILLMRLRTAASLLKAQSSTIKQVAYEVGFKSESYFSSKFKEVYGVSPSQFVQMDEAANTQF